MRKIFSFMIAMAVMTVTAVASADLVVVDFTAPGSNPGNNALGTSFTFSGADVFDAPSVMTPTGVSFTVVASNGLAVGNISSENAGLGSRALNVGDFLNVIDGVSEVITFTISDVTGLAPGESLVLDSLLSQDSNGNFGGNFGNVAQDSVTFTSDDSSSVVINQSGGVDLGSIILATNDNNDTNTENTFAHSAGDLTFTNSFDLAQTDLTRNDAVQIQGLQFRVVPAAPAVPEPSSALALLSLLGVVVCKRRRS